MMFWAVGSSSAESGDKGLRTPASAARDGKARGPHLQTLGSNFWARWEQAFTV